MPASASRNRAFVSVHLRFQLRPRVPGHAHQRASAPTRAHTETATERGATLPTVPREHVQLCHRAQGLNFVAALLLLHTDEASAFALLSTITDRLLPEYHTPSMLGLQRGQASLVAAMERALPAVIAHLREQGVPVLEQSTGWLLCCFADVLQLSVRVSVCWRLRRSVFVCP
eukprot:6191318-Pleurochrysis_carterae.AAC.1